MQIYILTTTEPRFGHQIILSGGFVAVYLLINVALIICVVFNLVVVLLSST